MTLNIITLIYLNSFTQVDALLHKYAAKGVNINELSAAIKHESASAGVDAILLTKLVIIESRGNPKAVNKKTGDMGVLQINKLHKIQNECVFDVRCNIKIGARILKNFMSHKRYRPCMFNVGYRVKERITACKKYEEKLWRL